MNLQCLIVVVLRLIALDFLLRTTLEFTARIIWYLPEYKRSSVGDLWLMLLPWLLVIGLQVAAIILWFLALPIARLVTRGVSQDLSFGTMSLVDCYSIAFIAVGLFYICSHLAQVVNWAHFILKTAVPGRGYSEQTFNGYDVSQALITFIVGIVLFVKGRKWAVALARRHAESPQAISERRESDT